MTEGSSNFLTEISQVKDQCGSKNLRHRQEIQAKHFEQVAFLKEEEEKLDAKKSKHNQKQKKSVLSDSDSDSSSDHDSSFYKDAENDDSSSKSSCQSDSDSEEHNIWDNSDYEIYGVDLENLKFCNSEEQKFFTLYKLRYCQIREFLTKILTQKQHQDINVNILKIVKALSQNKVLKIQCHNYNYFQPLQDNKAYKKFAQHFGDYKNKRKNQQIEQKKQYIQSLKDKSINQKSFTIKQFDGIKAPMNRASFSSSQKETSPQSYFLTLRESHNGNPNQMKLITKSKCDSSLQTQDTFNSQTKRTLKDFEIDSDQTESKQKESQLQTVNKQINLNNYNFHITSLTHIGDSNEQNKRIETFSHALNQTPQKKFKISHIQTTSQISKTTNHLSYTSTPLLPQQKNLLKSINQSPNTQENSINNKIDNHFQNLYSQKQPQLNNFINYDSNQMEQSQQTQNQNISISPFICQNSIDVSPKNKTKQRILPHLQMSIPTRELQHNINNNSNNCYYQLNNSQMIRLYNTKTNSSLSNSRKQTILNFQSPLPSYKQFDKVPDLKQIKQVNQNNSNIHKITQIRSTSNYTNSNQTPQNFNESTLTNTPLSRLNRLAEQPTESTFSKYLEKQSSQKEENAQEANLQSPQYQSSQLQKIKIYQIYNSSSGNLNNKLVIQKQVLASNQSYGTLQIKQIEGEQKQTNKESVNQEYMISNTDENQNKNIINMNQNEINKTVAGAPKKNNNNQIYYNQIQKNIFRKSFFKNQYIDNSSTINKQLVQHFKQITQN
ncbi:hypothetical protein ABPG72_005560 [Tetrahymena utriculariae]